MPYTDTTALLDKIREQVHAVRNADDTDAMHRESVTLTDLIESLHAALRTGAPLPSEWQHPVESGGGRWVWQSGITHYTT